MCVVSAILICVVSLVLQQQMNKFCYRVILDVLSVHRSYYPKIYRVEMGFASFRLAVQILFVHAQRVQCVADSQL